MKVYLQSRSYKDLSYAAKAGLLDGITLSLGDLETDALALHDQLNALADKFAVPVCVPVSVVTSDEIYREARTLAKMSDFVIVQVPFIDDAIIPIRKLVSDGIRVCATYIYTGAQAYLAAKIGATMSMVHVDDLDAHGHQSAQLVGEIRRVLDQGRLECDLIVASPRSSTHFTECLLAGADTVCTTREMIQAFMQHSLTDRGIDRLLSHLSRLHKPRSE